MGLFINDIVDGTYCMAQIRRVSVQMKLVEAKLKFRDKIVHFSKNLSNEKIQSYVRKLRSILNFFFIFENKNDLTRSVQVALTVNYTLHSNFSCNFCHENFHLFGAYYFYICWFQTFFRENGPILKKMDHVIRDNKNFRQSRIFQNF